MGRKTLLIVGALVAGTAVTWWWNRPAAGPTFVASADQNVLLITIDTLRADALGAYGGRAATPHLDRLAAEGVRFTFAHAHAVVTLPSHSSIMTGRYPYEHGVRDNAGFRLDDKADTLTEILKRQGFATGAFVGAFPLDRQFGLAQGFDVYDDVGGREVAQGDFRFTERRAEEVVSAATRWIDGQQNKWFTWVHVFDPHSSYSPPPPFDAQYAADPYTGEVAYVDKALAPLLERARRGPRPTTVIVTSDHGEGLGEHGEATHGVFAYESTLRVPLILAQMSNAAQPPRGATVDQPVRHVDIIPTLAGLLQFSAPANLPGRSLLDTNRDAAETTYFESMTPMVARGWAPLSGVIVGRDKYIDLPIEELYDLAADPNEQQNLVAKQPDRARELAGALRQFSADLPGEARAETADVRARLQALGYVSGSSPRKETYSEADDPKNLVEVDRLMMEGIEHNRRGRHREAIETYRRVVERRPDMALAYLRLAFMHWDAGQPSEAIATLRKGLKKNGPDIDLEVRLGTYLAETGSAEAVPLLEKAAAARPENGEAQNALGIAYARTGQPHKARQAFERALQANPRDVLALENMGTIHLVLGKPDNFATDPGGAAEWFRRALAEDPRSSRAHAGLGVLARRAGRSDEAVGHWRKAVEFDRSNFDALYNLATELATNGRQSEARPYMRDFVQRAPAAFYAREIAMFREFLAR